MTIMALHPDHLYDVVAINAASASTQLAGLPFSGPIGATRVAHIDGQWVAFPTHTELERRDVRHGRRRPGARGRRRRDHDGRGGGHGRGPCELVGRRRDGADRGGRRRRAGGRQAVHPGAVRGAVRARRRRQGARRPAGEYPALPRLRGRRLRGRRRRGHRRAGAALRIGGQAGAGDRARPGQGARRRAGVAEVRGPREGDLAGAAGADQEARPQADHRATRSASTAAGSPTSATCPPRSRSCRGCTARRCSSAARPRSSA